jgi:hypothetical protein
MANEARMCPISQAAPHNSARTSGKRPTYTYN